MAFLSSSKYLPVEEIVFPVLIILLLVNDLTERILLFFFFFAVVDILFLLIYGIVFMVSKYILTALLKISLLISLLLFE